MVNTTPRRRGFGLFRRNKAGPTRPTALTSHNVNADNQDNQDEQRAFIVSLQNALAEQTVASVASIRAKDDEINRILATVRERDDRIRDLFETFKDKEDQIKGFVETVSDQEEQLRSVLENASQLSEENSQLRQTAATVSRLEESNAELREQLQEYQVSLARTAEAQYQAEQEVEALKLANAKLEHECDMSCPKDVRELGQQVEVLKSSVRQESSWRQYWKSHAASLIKERDAQQSEIERLKALTESSWTVLTPRQVIINKILRDDYQNRSGADSTANDRVKSATFKDLTSDLLDAELSPEQARCFYDEADPRSLFVLACRMCGLLKLGSRTGHPFDGEFAPTSEVHERGICPLKVCKKCYLHGVVDQVQEGNWMANLHESSWLACPTPNCPWPSLRITNREEFSELLLRLEDDEYVSHVVRFGHCIDLRSGLAELWPDSSLDETATDIAFQLHESLVKEGLMFSIWDLEAVARPDPLFSDPGDLEMVEIELDSTLYRVPLFTSLLRQDGATQECLYCVQEFPGSQATLWARWATAYPQFCGDWVWKRLQFPDKLALTCTHPIDFCTSCLDRHIKAKLDDDGVAGCDKIACPGADCRRPLGYEEIRLYSTDETFAMYDQYLYLKTLSQFPNFRWCLGSGCDNGQLYELQDGQDVPEGGPLIQCEACSFKMCYTHSVPWHTGQTCAQYDSDHNDPNSQLSRDWIDSNTKKCPKCSVPINKGKQCFHMTCNCGFEFCWLCLVDWKLIRTYPGVYNQNAHKENCYFRTSDVLPTQLMGTTLDAALERYQRPT